MQAYSVRVYRKIGIITDCLKISLLASNLKPLVASKTNKKLSLEHELLKSAEFDGSAEEKDMAL